MTLHSILLCLPNGATLDLDYVRTPTTRIYKLVDWDGITEAEARVWLTAHAHEIPAIYEQQQADWAAMHNN